LETLAPDFKLVAMEPICRAVIDVGTNSIKLLVAEIVGTRVHPVYETSRQTRLGRGFYQTHRLRTEAISATAETVAAFAAEARARQASGVRVIATSAAREATNSDELSQAIAETSGLPVEIISGEQEAEWVFQGVSTDSDLAGEKLLLLDVGGGSTEFILGHNHHMHFRASFPLGTLRLLESAPLSDPPNPDQLAACRQWLRSFFQDQVQSKLKPALEREDAANRSTRPLLLVGSGGTATILARMEQEMENYDRARIEATRIGLDRLRAQLERLWHLPLEERKKIVGLPPNRADVILSGIAIYEAAMEVLKFEDLRISTRGLRFAAVMSASQPVCQPAVPGPAL
jgi:exopolyphosphatase/guanosine-5'-triphosphate,3'-diphosphate pyrophosphatase